MYFFIIITRQLIVEKRRETMQICLSSRIYSIARWMVAQRKYLLILAFA